MTRRSCAVAVSFGILTLAGATGAFGADEKGKAIDARAAFARLKALDGTWKAIAHMKGQPAPEKPETVSYHVTANGSVVMETLFAGTGHEMVSMYHLDGDDLRLTHYCAMKNQPHLKLDKAASTPNTLVFAFDGGTNLDPAKDSHMHSGKITFRDDKHVDSEWEGYAGKEKMHTMKFELSRP
jgi:hypothetical protein